MKTRGIGIFLSVLCASVLLGGCGVLPFKEKAFYSKDGQKASDAKTTAAEPPAESTPEPTAVPAEATAVPEEQKADESTADMQKVLDEAHLMSVQYDYDGAIRYLKEQPEYETTQAYKDAVTQYENIKATCVEYPLEEVTHVFFHTLIVDTSKAFDGDSDEAGYNQMMTTVSEFNKIMQSMYDKGYVLVSPHDMAVVNEDGTMSRGKIMLPPGKKAFVLSQDDVSYYHYMDGDGFASKMVLDENGDVKCEYIQDDGTVLVGDYDMVPLLDGFVKANPAFSYHGRK